jgi:hypothetical protein
MIRRVHVGAIVAIDHRKKRRSLRGLILDPWAVMSMPAPGIRSSSGEPLCGLLLREVASHMLTWPVGMPVPRRATAIARSGHIKAVLLVGQNKYQAVISLTHFHIFG